MELPIQVTVKARAKENKFDEENKIVCVKEKAEGNKANLAVVKLLSKFFKKPVKIKSGLRSKSKIISLK